MSDTFNHELDAYESQLHEASYECSDVNRRFRSVAKKAHDSCDMNPAGVFRKSSYSEQDKLDRYFTQYTFELVEAETPKALLLLMVLDAETAPYPESIWIPKSIVRSLSREDRTVYIHTDTFGRIYAEYKEKNNV